MRDVLLSFGLSLGLTLLLEIPPGLLAARKGKTGFCFLIFLLVNVLTNPAVVGLTLLARRYLDSPLPLLCELALEVLAVLAEGAVFRSFREDLKIGRPFLLSLGLNLWSYGVGLILIKLM